MSFIEIAVESPFEVVVAAEPAVVVAELVAAVEIQDVSVEKKKCSLMHLLNTRFAMRPKNSFAFIA